LVICPATRRKCRSDAYGEDQQSGPIQGETPSHLFDLLKSWRESDIHRYSQIFTDFNNMLKETYPCFIRGYDTLLLLNPAQ
jgi:hypothetical protein